MKLDNFDIDNFRFYFEYENIGIEIENDKLDLFISSTDDYQNGILKKSYRIKFHLSYLDKYFYKIDEIYQHLSEFNTDFCFCMYYYTHKISGRKTPDYLAIIKRA